MPNIIAVTKDATTANILKENGFKLKLTSQKGNQFFVKEKQNKNTNLLKSLPEVKEIDSNTLQTLFSQNEEWGGEDVTIPEGIDIDELSDLMSKISVKGGARSKGRKTRSKSKSKSKSKGKKRANNSRRR
jgi:hypothetical protein